ncbi:MAG TPA: DUF6290 family protein [Mesorhizobium sp.]|jgi:RHH-type rel operon transcriptional repressor/antitoxin RelB|nr:DUF6290 family protein [Mesorhizobium sp.]
METITLEPELDRWLTEVAARAGRPKQDVVREAVIRALEDLEDVQEADEVMRRLERGEERTIPLEDVVRRLGLED